MKKLLSVVFICLLLALGCEIKQESLVPKHLLGNWSRRVLSTNPYSLYEYYAINNDNMVHRKIQGGITTIDESFWIKSVENKGDGNYWFFFSNYNYRIDVAVIDNSSIKILGNIYNKTQSSSDNTAPSEISNLTHTYQPWSNNPSNHDHYFTWTNPIDNDLYEIEIIQIFKNGTSEVGWRYANENPIVSITCNPNEDKIIFKTVNNKMNKSNGVTFILIDY